MNSVSAAFSKSGCLSRVTRLVAFSCFLAVCACGEQTPDVMTESTPALASREQAVVANKVLILASTVVNGASSQEAVAATRLGMAVEVVTPAQWAAKTSADFATYRAIILGDPNCGSATAINAAVSTRNTWGPMVNGNVVIVGTAPVFYQRT